MKPHGLFGGVNFMTPHVLGYFKLRKGLGYAELSEGTGINHNPIFGVTVQKYGQTSMNDLSKMFYSLTEAHAYIKSLS